MKLEFLPPYSPDFNPIEEAFMELKTWMKKNYILAENFASFQEFIEVALRHMASKPGNHFRSYFIEILSSIVDE
jgi:hypothetical protein